MDPVKWKWWTLSSGGSVSKESTFNAGDPSSILRSGRSAGEGNGNPLQYSYLENPMDRAQRSLAGYHPSGLKSWTQLSY